MADCKNYEDEIREKQIPMKFKYSEPVSIKCRDEDKVQTFPCLPCPNCGKWVVHNTNHHFCEYCGQALDWGDSK